MNDRGIVGLLPSIRSAWYAARNRRISWEPIIDNDGKKIGRKKFITMSDGPSLKVWARDTANAGSSAVEGSSERILGALCESWLDLKNVNTKVAPLKYRCVKKGAKGHTKGTGGKKSEQKKPEKTGKNKD